MIFNTSRCFQIKTIPEYELGPSGDLKVTLTHLETTSCLWLTPTQLQSSLDKLMDQVQVVAPDLKPVKTVRVGAAAVAR